MTERLLNAREVADFLGISPATVLDRFERGDLRGFRLYGRVGAPVRFRLSELLDDLEAWRPTSPATPVVALGPAKVS